MDAIKQQLTTATTGKTKPEREGAASAFAAAVAKEGVAFAFHECKLNEAITSNFAKEGKKGRTCSRGCALLRDGTVQGIPQCRALPDP